MKKNERNRKYVYSLIAAITGVLVLLQLINFLVDPLWYYSGNRLFPENYTFNERFSKTNYYLRNPKKYDCILFGSSKVTLIDPKLIENYTCFNFAFSGGTVREFIDYVDYIKVMGSAPKLVIVGVDEDSFIDYPLPRIVPDFILKKEKPPHVLASYTTYDALSYSIRTLMKQAMRPRYYDESFIGDFLPDAHSFNPAKAKYYVRRRDGEYYPQNLNYYEQLRKQLPDALFWGYVPPFSAYLYDKMEKTGALDKYLRLIYIAQKQYHQFYDFSVPGKFTAGTKNTYDGMHYDHATNIEVINAINGKTIRFGINVKKFTLDQYLALHNSALKKFRIKNLAGVKNE